MAAASSITTSSAWPSFTESAGWMYCKREDAVTASSSLPALRETSQLTQLEPWKALCCPCSPQTPSQRLRCGKARSRERVYVGLARIGSHILFSTVPHEFICRGEEHKGNLITKSSSCTVPSTFLLEAFLCEKPTWELCNLQVILWKREGILR